MKKGEIRSTHSCLAFMMVFAQTFGMLPVSGITHRHCKMLEFKWTSKRTIYSVAFATSAITSFLFQIIKMVKDDDTSFAQFVTLLFLLVSVLTVMLFIDVARKWPLLMTNWTKTDEGLSNYGFPVGLHKKLQIISATVLTAAFVEHSLFLSFALKYSKRGETVMESIDSYLEGRFRDFFSVVKYNILWGLFLQVLNIFSTISWSFMDLFIILMSVTLSSRFSQLNKRVRFHANRQTADEKLWRKLREDYTKVTVLCSIVDDVVSNIVLLSFGNNIFVILVQLLNTLLKPPSQGLLDKAYYLYSFGFLLIRITAVALYAATVNSESNKPMYYLTTLPHCVYNIEIERFIYHIKLDTAALTGHKLFRVTKSLILSIAGAIVSYELVLIQFNVA